MVQIRACFSLPAVGMIGNLGRFALVGPGLVNQDFSVMKSTRVTERINLQFRAEISDLFNHADFALPASTSFVSGPVVGAGAISPSAGTVAGRRKQFRGQIDSVSKLLF